MRNITKIYIFQQLLIVIRRNISFCRCERNKLRSWHQISIFNDFFSGVLDECTNHLRVKGGGWGRGVATAAAAAATARERERTTHNGRMHRKIRLCVWQYALRCNLFSLLTIATPPPSTTLPRDPHESCHRFSCPTGVI